MNIEKSTFIKVLITLALLIPVLFLTGCPDPTSPGVETNPVLTMDAPTVSAAQVTAGQKTETFSISVKVTGADGAAADSVILTGDKISSTTLTDSNNDGTWEASFTPDATASSANDVLTYTVTASDSVTSVNVSKTFTLTVKAKAVVNIAAYISKFITNGNNPVADGGEPWFEVTINDVSELRTDWALKYATYQYLNDAFLSTNAPAALADGDIIRIHSQGTGATFDTISKDGDSFGNTNVWDFEANNQYVNDGDNYGMFIVQVGDSANAPTASNTIDIIPWNDPSANSSNYWLTDGTANVATYYSEAVTAGLWTDTDSTNSDEAVQLFGGTDTCSAAAPATNASDVTIDTAAVISISTSGSVEEESTTSGRFTLTRTGATTNALTVNVTLSEANGASKGTDYTVTPDLTVGSGTITIAAGSTTAVVEITAIDDTEDDDGESVTLKVNAGTGYGLSTTTERTFLITDNDGTAPSGGLFISEVADPSTSSGRFVELYNASGATIDFNSETFFLVRQSNGGTTYGRVQLTGALSPSTTYVIGSASALESNYGAGTADLDTGIINGNGDDAYYLYSGGNESSGTLVDIYGEKDTDGSGSDWEYLDSHAVRNTTVTMPKTIWDASEWTITAGDIEKMTPGVR